MQRALLILASSVVMLARQMHDVPLYAPSLEVHITRSHAGGPVNTVESSRQHWAAYGFGLKQIVSFAWHQKFERVFANADVESGHFDFVLVPPHQLSEEERSLLLRTAVEQHFQVRVVKEQRTIQVDVITAPQGKAAALREAVYERPPQGVGRIQGGGLGGSNRELSGQNAAMQDLCDLIERFENTWVVDETNLKGHYSFKVKGDGDFRKMLREQLGLVLSRDWRRIDVLEIERR